MSRPDYITDEQLDYLDELRESKETDMFRATLYIQIEFGVDQNEATKILKYWMETFGKKDR